jgi:rubrerythrin
MPKEQDATLLGLQTAIQMEIDGKEFYIRASQASKNELGKKLLKQLSVEEDIHRKAFESIYKKISAHQGWPAYKASDDRIQGLRTIFADAVQAMGKEGVAITTEPTAVQTAMDMENKTYDFYKKRSAAAIYSGEKDFYEEIAAQEKEHHRLLAEYFEYLQDPQSYFVQKEHLSVDGG